MSDDVRGDGWIGPPALPRWLVRRSDALEELDRIASDCPITLVTGAPGSGKSVLAASWIDHAGVPAIWVRFRAADATPTRAGARILDAAGLADAAATPGLGPAELTSVSFRERLVAQLAAMAERRPGLRIVFDDVHRLAVGESRAALGELIDDLIGVPVVVLSRFDPTWPLHRWRLDGRLGELRQHVLDLDDATATALLERIAPGRLAEQETKEIVTRCGGWAAAVVLAGHSAQAHPDPPSFVRAFSGADRGVADYLLDEVLANLDDDDRWFLLSTSVCLRFNAELAAALSGLPDCAARLRDLYGRLMLLIPDSERAGWFHYHDLLGDMLRQQLLIDHPEQREPLLHAAAAWHEARGDLNAQCTYLAAVEDWPAIADAVRAAGRSGFQRRSHHVLIGCLELIPPSRWDPATTLTLASMYLSNGQPWRVDELLDRVRSHPDTGAQHRLHAEVVVACGIEWDRSPTAVLTTVERLLAWLDAVPPEEIFTVVTRGQVAGVRQVVEFCRGRAHDLAGDPERALACYRAAKVDDGDPMWTIFALGGEALTEARRGRVERAAGFARRAIDGAASLGMGGEPVVANAHLALAIVAAERDDARCAAHLVEARLRCEGNNRWATLSEVRIRQADLLGRRGDLVAAHAGLDALDASPPLAEQLVSDAAAVRAKLFVRAGRPDQARAALAAAAVRSALVLEAEQLLADADRRTGRSELVEALSGRELEVLAALTSHRTSAQIAVDLTVSIHTVKTHQRHIYRKLGVVSRSEAVEAATRMGLLPT